MGMIFRKFEHALAMNLLAAATLFVAPSAVCASVVPPGPVRQLETGTPLLSDFDEFCLRTGASMDSAVNSARRDRLEVHSWRRQPAATYRPRAMWFHSSRDHVVLISYTLMKWTKRSSMESPMCVVEDTEDKGASLASLKRWIGAPLNDRAFSAYEFRLSADGPHLIAHSNSPALKAARASGDFFVLVVHTRGGLTSLTLRRWLGPA